MHLTEQQMTEAQLTEAQQRLRAEQRLREMKDNPWSEFNAHHCVMDGFEIENNLYHSLLLFIIIVSIYFLKVKALEDIS